MPETMSLFETIGEAFDPGPIGTLASPTDLPTDVPSRAAGLVRGTLGVALLAGWLYLSCARWAHWNLNDCAIIVVATVVYLGFGYRVRPEPNYDNVGWFSGFMDNPFRISDDINRFLVLLMPLLWPARFVATSLLGLARARSRRAAETSLGHVGP
jgi:hypothetical protein